VELFTPRPDFCALGATRTATPLDRIGIYLDAKSLNVGHQIAGARSLIVTFTVRQFSKFVTRTTVPKGSARCAAVSAWYSVRSRSPSDD
jgi:hypothetical protein